MYKVGDIIEDRYDAKWLVLERSQMSYCVGANNHMSYIYKVQSIKDGTVFDRWYDQTVFKGVVQPKGTNDVIKQIKELLDKL